MPWNATETEKPVVYWFIIRQDKGLTSWQAWHHQWQACAWRCWVGYMSLFFLMWLSRTIFISCSATATTQREETRSHGKSSSTRTNNPARGEMVLVAGMAGGSANWKMQSTPTTTNNHKTMVNNDNYKLMPCLVNYETWNVAYRGGVHFGITWNRA